MTDEQSLLLADYFRDGSKIPLAQKLEKVLSIKSPSFEGWGNNYPTMAFEIVDLYLNSDMKLSGTKFLLTLYELAQRS